MECFTLTVTDVQSKAEATMLTRYTKADQIMEPRLTATFTVNILITLDSHDPFLHHRLSDKVEGGGGGGGGGEKGGGGGGFEKL